MNIIISRLGQDIETIKKNYHSKRLFTSLYTSMVIYKYVVKCCMIVMIYKNKYSAFGIIQAMV